jgi:hypothetical protein
MRSDNLGSDVLKATFRSPLFQLHLCEKFHVIPWLLIEFVFCGLWAFFYLTTAIDTAVVR